MEENGIMLPVSEFQVKYLGPAKYDDELTITTKITEINGPRIYFEYSISNESGKLISTASTTLVFVSRETMKPQSPPNYFLDLMSNYEI